MWWEHIGGAAWTALLVWTVVTQRYIYTRVDELENTIRQINNNNNNITNNSITIDVTRNVTWTPDRNTMAASKYTQSLPPASAQFTPEPNHLNNYTVMHPALHALGLVYVQGDLVVTSCILFQVAPSHFVNTCKWWEDLNGMNAVCAVSCGHGTRNLISCDCVCDHGWISDPTQSTSCNVHSCNENGVWDPDTNLCICYEDYTVESNCGIHAQPPTSSSSSSSSSSSAVCHSTEAGFELGEGADAVCVCKEKGTLGPKCDPSTACATPIRDTALCHKYDKRTNWGKPYYGTATPFGVCPGGYVFDTPNIVRIKALRCAPHATACSAEFTADAAVCCAPNVLCDGHNTRICDADDATCCREYAAAEWTCLHAGCAWCGRAPGAGSSPEGSYPLNSDGSINTNAATLCAPRAPGGDAIGVGGIPPQGCTQPALVNTITTRNGTWMSWTFDCSQDDPTTNICNRVVREEYLQFYYDACPDIRNVTRECLTTAYNNAINQPWLDLRPLSNVEPQTPQQVAMHSLPYTEPSCEHALVLGIDESSMISPYLGALATWVCPDSATQQRYKIWLEDSIGGYYLFVRHIRYRYTFCLAADPLSLASSAYIFGSTEYAGVAVWVNIQEPTTSSYMNIDTLCGGIHLTGSSDDLVLASEQQQFLTITASGIAKWSQFGIALTITDLGTTVHWLL